MNGLNISELMQAAVALHELKQTFVKAGFTQQEAMYLTGQALTNGGNTPQEKQ